MGLRQLTPLYIWVTARSVRVFSRSPLASAEAPELHTCCGAAALARGERAKRGTWLVNLPGRRLPPPASAAAVVHVIGQTQTRSPHEERMRSTLCHSTSEKRIAHT